MREVKDLYPRAQSILAMIYMILGLLGGYVHWRRDRK
jgi:hypothetical protein